MNFWEFANKNPWAALGVLFMGCLIIEVIVKIPYMMYKIYLEYKIAKEKICSSGPFNIKDEND